MHLREARPADRRALDDLFELAAECDGHFPIGEHKYLDVMEGVGRVAGTVGEVDGEILAYIAVTPPKADGIASLEVAIHPLRRSHQVIAESIAIGLRTAREEGATRVRVWVFQPNMVDELQRAGFTPERELRQLRIDLPLDVDIALPAGMEEARFRPDRDVEAWLDVNNAAFEWHPENGAWTAGILDDRVQQAWFDAEAFLMVWAGSELAGFCWTKPHENMGEIYVVAVSPAYQGRGLGRYLVVRGLDVIDRHLGFDTGMLYMDADNAPAARLYEGLGFRLHHVDRSLLLRLD